MAVQTVSRRAVARLIAAKMVSEPAKNAKWLAMGAAYLVERHQADRVNQLVQDIAREYFVLTGELAATVETAFPLAAQLRTELEQMIAKATGATSVSLSETVDTSVLAGYRVKTPDHEINTTARDRLRRLKSLEV